ncbi:hypothetical protein D3C85_1588380 [compost metagenome]
MYSGPDTMDLLRPASDATFTMRPHLFSIMPGSTSCVICIKARELTRMISKNCSSVASSKPCGLPSTPLMLMPALLTRISMAPCLPRMSPATFRISAALFRSRITARARSRSGSPIFVSSVGWRSVK